MQTNSMKILLLKVFVLVPFVCIYFAILTISQKEDWRNEVSTSMTETVFKSLMTSGCSVPGLRLMCSTPDGKPFQLKDLSVWDTLLGCFFYALAFITFLWFMTPFPDVKVVFVFFTQFTPRSDDEPQAIDLIDLPPVWHPAGGEGLGVHIQH